MNHRACRAVVCATLIVVNAAAASAAGSGSTPPESSPEATDRPRVGLVLGGGGARGGAHIGVLRELERLKVPIDAIAGTSIGAVVGGLYASGVSTSELEEIVATMDWASALSGRPARDDLSFRRRQDDADFPIGLEFGYRDGRLQTPQGFVQGQQLDLVLRELTRHVAHVDDFDALSIPFRAVASDIGSGEMAVLDSGDLALAIRASMSVPGAIAPVVVDGRLLADGGLVGNLPVSVMRDMDVDVIIAVNVEFPLYPEEQLDSALAITEQVLTILIRKETLHQIDRLNEGDVLIEPELGLFASSDFAGIDDVIEPGAEATRGHAGRLQGLAVGADDYMAWQQRRQRAAPKAGSLAFVRIEHDSRFADETLLSHLTVEAGDPIDSAVLADDANRLYGMQVFEKVDYRLVRDGRGTGVEFTATEKSWGPSYLRFGMSLDDNIEGDTRFNVRARLTRPAINRFGGEWRADLQLGTDPRAFTEFYQPLSQTSRLFVAPSAEYRNRTFNVFVDGDAATRLRQSELIASFDAGIAIGNFAEFRTGLFRGYGDADVKVGDPSTGEFDFQSGGLQALLRIDSLDDPFWPRSGINGEFRWESARIALGDDNDVDMASARFDVAHSFGRNTVVVGGAYATTLRGDGGPRRYFPLGGLLQLSGLQRGQVAGPHAALGRLLYYRQVGEQAGGLFDVPVYLGASLELGNTWQRRSEISFDGALVNGSIFGGLKSLFGPVYLAVGFGEGGETSYYLSIGDLPF